MDQAAVAALAGDDDRPRLAALEHERGGVEAQLGLLLVRAVALEAVLAEDRLDVAEVIDLGGTGNRRQQGDGQEREATFHVTINGGLSDKSFRARLIRLARRYSITIPERGGPARKKARNCQAYTRPRE